MLTNWSEPAPAKPRVEVGVKSPGFTRFTLNTIERAMLAKLVVVY